MKNSRLFLLLIFLLSSGFIFSQTLLEWPLKQVNNFNDPSYYYISNHVDHDSTSSLLDYDGGTRTYNGHDGTDLVLWPYWWKKMEENQVQVVASADGIITDKADGFFDQSCSWDGGNWNFLKVTHMDGSYIYYGHLKKNSVTGLAIGDSIFTGDYVGLVGSSGNSDKPHLHFEVRDSNDNLIDPFDGTFNMTTNVSWWHTQPNYYDSGLNYINLSPSIPENISSNCPTPEDTKRQCFFSASDTIVLTRYYRHSVVGQHSECKIYQPDGTIWSSWDHFHNATSRRRYSWNTRVLPSNAQNGKWTFEVKFMGDYFYKSFYVDDFNCSCEINLDSIDNMSYHAAVDLISNAIVNTTDSLYLKAGSSIVLNPGFQTNDSTFVECQIIDCDQ